MRKKISTTDTGSVTRILGELAKQREHYGRATMEDLKNYLKGNTDVECLIEEGDGYAVGVLIMHNKKILNKGPSHWVANAWFDGNIEADAAMEIMIDIAKKYCAKYKVKTLCHIAKKDLQGKVADLKITKPLDQNLHWRKINENFDNVTIEERKKDFLYVITL